MVVRSDNATKSKSDQAEAHCALSYETWVYPQLFEFSSFWFLRSTRR
jgi:hypothetical protein